MEGAVFVLFKELNQHKAMGVRKVRFPTERAETQKGERK